MRTIGSISADLCEMQRLRDYNLQLHAKDLKWQRRIAAAATSMASASCQPSTIERSTAPDSSASFAGFPLISSHSATATTTFSTQSAPPVSSASASASLPMSSIALTMTPSTSASGLATASPIILTNPQGSTSASFEANVDPSMQLSMPASTSMLAHVALNAFTPASACPSPSFPFSASVPTSTAASVSVPASASGGMSCATMSSVDAYALTAATLASLGVTPTNAHGFPSATAAHAHALPVDAHHAHYPSTPFVMPMMFTTPSAAKPPLPAASPATAAAALMSSVSAPAYAVPISMPMHFHVPSAAATIPAFPTAHAITSPFLAPSTSAVTSPPAVSPSITNIPSLHAPVVQNATSKMLPPAPGSVSFTMAPSVAPSMAPVSTPSTPEVRQNSVASSESPTANRSLIEEEVGTSAQVDGATSADMKSKAEKKTTANAVKVSDNCETMSTSGSSSVTKRRVTYEGKRSEVSGGSGAATSGIGNTGLRSGIGKIRRHRMTKEEEARFNPRDLVDLTGSTAAKSRKMSNEERDIMLHKRRLRNRASAARSRDKQRKTINDVGDEVDELLTISQQLLERCIAAESSISELKQQNDALIKENRQLRNNQQDSGDNFVDRDDDKVVTVSEAPPAPATTALKRTGSTLHVSMSSDMLDKLMGTGIANGDMGLGSGLMKISSTLHLSLSTDRLSEGSNGSFPCISGSLPPLTRNASIVDRLLDISGSNTAGGGDVQTRRIMREHI